MYAGDGPRDDSLAHKKEMDPAYRDRIGALREELEPRQLGGEKLALVR